MISLREAFGQYLLQLAKENENFVVLDADVAGGTNTNYFRDTYPKRFIQCGIAEQNMMSVASGISTTGIIPIVTAYGVFSTLRPLDQIRNSIAYPRTNVKIVASHPGLDVGPDGATHQAIEDLSIMRSIPNMVVISPCDNIELEQATKAILEYDGPVYMRSGRSPVPTLNHGDYKFKIGKATVLQKGQGDVTIFATGIMVHRALEATKDTNTTVINVSTLKPLDIDTIIKYSQNKRKIITCEDHSIIGGLGSAIAEVLSENCINVHLKRIGIKDCFGASGEPEELAVKYNISTEDIRNELKNKIVFVTGASKGIGKAIANAFQNQNYTVVYGYNSTKPNDNNFYVKVDISSRDSIRNAIQQTREKFGHIDILINNAAIAQEKPFLTITDEDWKNMLDINLQGAFRFSQEVLENMIQNKWGRIINITSIGGQWGGFNQVHYAASKAALISFTQSLAKIYSKNGITTNAISPGLIATEMSKNELNSEAGKEKVKNIPIGRLGSTEDIADIAIFLASENASYITGQTINANGGMYFG